MQGLGWHRPAEKNETAEIHMEYRTGWAVTGMVIASIARARRRRRKLKRSSKALTHKGG